MPVEKKQKPDASSVRPKSTANCTQRQKQPAMPEMKQERAYSSNDDLRQSDGESEKGEREKKDKKGKQKMPYSIARYQSQQIRGEDPWAARWDVIQAGTFGTEGDKPAKNSSCYSRQQYA